MEGEVHHRCHREREVGRVQRQRIRIAGGPGRGLIPLAVRNDQRQRCRVEGDPPGDGGVCTDGDPVEADDLGKEHFEGVTAGDVLGCGDDLDGLACEVEIDGVHRCGTIGGVGVCVRLGRAELVVAADAEVAGTILADGQGACGGAELELAPFLPDAPEVDDERRHRQEPEQHDRDEHDRCPRLVP